MPTCTRRLMMMLLTLAVLPAAPLPALAADKATADDAVAMVKAGVAYLKKNGRDKALAEFMNPKGPFIKGELYIFAFDDKGNNLAHINPKMVGKNLLEMRSADDAYPIKNVIAIGNSKEGKGWQDYKWPNPVTGAIESKRSYTEVADGVYISAGIYK